MTAFWNVGWLNANTQRNYPLAETASGKDTSGSFEIPAALLADLVITVPVDRVPDPSALFISSVAVFASGVVLVISLADGPVCSITIPDTAEDYSVYRLAGLGNFLDVTGWATFGHRSVLAELPPGAYTFDVNGGRIEASAVRPDIQGVASLRVYQAGNYSERLTGDVTLAAGQNIRFSVSPGDNQIRIDAVADDLASDCECEDPALLLLPITRVNDAYPDATGRIDVLGDSCLRVTSSGDTLQLDDLCSEPCCGCEELEKIRADAELVSLQALNAQTTLLALENLVSNMRDTILASKGA